MTTRAHFFVRGRVQGVSFRAHTAAQARALGLVGWVRNLADGRVEAVAEGPPEAVDALVAWARQGPSMAWVEHLELRTGPVQGEGPGFEITRTV